MKKFVLFTISVFVFCLLLNYITSVYAKNDLTFKFRRTISSNEESDYELDEDVNDICEGKKIELKSSNNKSIYIEIVKINKESYNIKIEGEVQVLSILEDKKNENDEYVLNYNEEYSLCDSDLDNIIFWYFKMIK